MLSKVTFIKGLMISSGAYSFTSNTVSVPQPESMSLIAIGLGLIGVIVVRKNNSRRDT